MSIGDVVLPHCGKVTPELRPVFTVETEPCRSGAFIHSLCKRWNRAYAVYTYGKSDTPDS